MSKKLFIKTYGCQMNVYDSDRMADVMRPLGYEPVDGPEEADLVVLNTCHIREKAAEKVYSELGRLRRLQERRRDQGARMLLAVGGCVGQAEGEEIFARAPFVDMVFGPQTYHRLPDLVREAEQNTSATTGHAATLGQPTRVIDTEFPVESKFDLLPVPRAPSSVSAFLSIQEGCDKFCTFCVVPYTRGAEVSRPVTAVVEEARLLVAGGARELTLLGQNVNAYHGEAPKVSVAKGGGGNTEWGLGRLIRELAGIEGLSRIRYTTSHPRDVDDDLIATHGAVEALMPFLHLPVQSGSDRVLTGMNRRHSGADYRRIVDRLRTARPDLQLSSDFIVGFPGEEASDFDDTMRLVDDIGFVSAYSFKYSQRPGTPAADLPQVPEAEKAARLTALQSLLAEQQMAFNRSLEGQTIPVLVEGEGRDPGQASGRSPWMQPVHFSDAPGIGDDPLRLVHVDRALKNSLLGTPVRPIPVVDSHLQEAAS